MYTWEQINEEKDKISVESHSEAVFTGINETILEGDNQARWFWELLQNAKDAVEDNQTVSVRLIITENEVVFKHDGNTFELAEILKLITQGSSKKGKAGKTGRFGTGFIATYILSRKVRIRGTLDDSTTFNFILDREADKAPDFLIKQQQSTMDFYTSFNRENQADLGPFTTSFTYQLSDIGKTASTSGLEEIAEYLPYVLAFNPKFKNISVNVKGVEMLYEKLKSIIYQGYSHLLEEVGITYSIEGEPAQQSVIKVIGDNWQSGFKIEITGDSRTFTSPNTHTPNLFASFPLLGTEVLGLPFVIHSATFGLKHERNGVFLGTGTNEVILQNKKSIEEAVATLPSILEWSLAQNVEHRFNIITFYDRQGPKWLDEQWLKSVKLSAITNIISIPLVTTQGSDNTPITIADLIIPGEGDTATRNTMLTLLKDFAPAKIPLEDEADKWHQFVVNAASFPDENQTIQKKKFMLPDFCSLIENEDNLPSLQKKLGTRAAIPWLNELYILLGGGDISLFYKSALVPVQSKQLVKVDVSIKIDEIKDETLYAVSELLGTNLFPTLVEPGIELPIDLCGSYKKEDLVNKLIAENALQPVTAFLDPKLMKANALMLKWLIVNKRGNFINAFLVITAGEDQSRNIIFFKHPLGAYSDKKQKLLAPKSIWRNTFKLFEKLVRDRDCLHHVYAEILSKDELEWLADNWFIHLSPLIKWTTPLNKSVATQLLKDPEKENLLFDENEFSKIEEITYSDFAFFTATDNHILSNSSTAQSSIEILQFALEEAVMVDDDYNQFHMVTLKSGQQVEFRKALWVGRLKNNQWINVKNISGEAAQHYSAERPSSQNLSGLINSAPYLKTLIRNEKATELLNLLGVSVSDLLKNTLSTDAEKVAWERAFTALLTANLDPVLAEVMLKDRSLQNEYRKRQQNMELINRNQQIGGLLEKEFKKLFLRPELLHLDIERRPFGSDYIISPESSDLVDENGEKIVFRVGSWYLELKATGKDYAAMTRLQAQRAVENPSSYALVVLPLNNYEINADNILKYIRFVRNIGEILTAKYNEVNLLKTQQSLVAIPTDKIEVAMEEEDIRYNVKASVWTHGEIMMDFVNSLK
ncbi:ATP-binding protein [Chitinophaga sp. LS1]|uniref:ATP-binding protein n=1 Tax=Chitinophaga sp. LS1 TaxID=3051176 RepID=UPI002AAB37ED|nr:ATP-binding protein [Chitinophaga sp. LS1]WPV67041.1 ATP-binding protein [Chitinophaga sp. LS1]